jgi:hypothetical protein
LSEDFEPDFLVVPARLFSWVEPLVVAAAEEGPFVAVLAFLTFPSTDLFCLRMNRNRNPDPDENVWLTYAGGCWNLKKIER